MDVSSFYVAHLRENPQYTGSSFLEDLTKPTGRPPLHSRKASSSLSSHVSSVSLAVLQSDFDEAQSRRSADTPYPFLSTTFINPSGNALLRRNFSNLRLSPPITPPGSQCENENFVTIRHIFSCNNPFDEEQCLKETSNFSKDLEKILQIKRSFLLPGPEGKKNQILEIFNTMENLDLMDALACHLLSLDQDIAQALVQLKQKKNILPSNLANHSFSSGFARNT